MREEHKNAVNGMHSLSEPRQQTLNRREAIKKSAFALGSCYLAPATLDLLLTDRASAQSAVVADTITFRNSSAVNVQYTYFDAANIRLAGVINPGEQISDSVLPGTDIFLLFNGQCLRINGMAYNDFYQSTAQFGSNAVTILNC